MVNWRTKNQSNDTQSQVLAWMIFISRKRNLNQLENCKNNAYKLSWNVCTWHELVDLTFFGQWANLLDRSPNGQELVTDGWLDWFHTFITQITTGNIVMWVTRLGIVDWVSSKTQILLRTFRIQNQPREESCVSLEVEHVVPVSWMCKKQTSVSNSSTESEIISLDAGLRMDGLLAPDFWDVVIDALRSSNSTKPTTNPAARNCSRNNKSNHKQKGNGDVDQLSHVDHVTTNAHSSQGESQLYMFDDNVAMSQQ